MNSLVSICIPTYHGAQFIAAALESAINQTYRPLEIIISDDASSDSTLSIVESYKSKTNFPIYVFNHQPKGIGANWNHCIKHANGQYIKFLFQDDVLMPECVETMVKALESDSSIALAACKRDIIYKRDYQPELVADWIERFGDLQEHLDLQFENGVSVIDQRLFKHKQFLKSPLNKIGEPSVFMFKKKVVKSIGYFREDLKQILDYEFCYRILKHYTIAIIEKPLVQFRLHPGQATNANKIVENSNENEGYTKILYREYLDYVDPYIKTHLLKKHHILYRVFYALKYRLKNLFAH